MPNVGSDHRMRWDRNGQPGAKDHGKTEKRQPKRTSSPKPAPKSVPVCMTRRNASQTRATVYIQIDQSGLRRESGGGRSFSRLSSADKRCFLGGGGGDVRQRTPERPTMHCQRRRYVKRKKVNLLEITRRYWVLSSCRIRCQPKEAWGWTRIDSVTRVDHKHTLSAQPVLRLSGGRK